MKKIFILILVVFSATCVNAADASLFEMRNKIIEESKEIKSLLSGSKNTVLVSSMWDSCIMTTMQLDAYFSMVGILNTIKKENINDISVEYLIHWLNEIKMTDGVNIKSLDSIPQAMEQKIKVHIGKLKDYFNSLDKSLDAECNKLVLFKKSLSKSRK